VWVLIVALLVLYFASQQQQPDAAEADDSLDGSDLFSFDGISSGASDLVNEIGAAVDVSGLSNSAGGFFSDVGALVTQAAAAVKSLIPIPIPDEIASLISYWCGVYGVPENLIRAQAAAESGRSGWQDARSPVGAIGVMQLMPATAAAYGVDAFEVSDNIRGGVMLMRDLLKQYGGDSYKAVAAYNWGSGHVGADIAQLGDAWDTNLPDETDNYANKVLKWAGLA
jgi:soluble lytic murein transglycosylase-like protein